MTGCVTVMCAAGTRENASAIASALVEGRLAACVQILPIESVYRWERAVACAPELLLLVKTTAERLAEAQALIGRLHAYALPEIAAVPIVAGSPDYLAWIAASVAP